jgi:hypothetical protein
MFHAFPDPLSWGPVTPFSPLAPASWFRDRSRYWNQIYGIGVTDSAESEAGQLRAYSEILQAKKLTLWSASDVDGFILAAWLAFVHHTCQTGCDFQIVKFPLRHGPSIGAMRREVVENPPSPRPVRKNEHDFLLEFWHAWSAPTPHLLLGLFKKSASSRPHHSLIATLLDRYPDAVTGLTSWDQALLEAVRDHGPRLAYVVSNMLFDVSDRERVGDAWLVSRLYELAESKHGTPLVTIDRPDAAFRVRGTVTLTEAGTQVLSGKTSALGQYWPNDWVGGVQLSASHSRWLRTQDGLVEWN